MQWLKTFFLLTCNSPFGIYCAALFSNPPNTSVCTSNPAETLFGTTDITLADYAYKAVRALYIIFKHAAGSKKGQKRSEYTEVLAQEADKKIN
jgi:hypothetical protein